MNVLEVCFKEYIAIINHLLQNENKIEEKEEKKVIIKEDFIYIRKEILFEYFSENPFKKNADKLSIWAEFNLIDRETKCLSKRVYIGDNKRSRMIVINRKRFNLASDLMESKV